MHYEITPTIKLKVSFLCSHILPLGKLINLSKNGNGTTAAAAAAKSPKEGP